MAEWFREQALDGAVGLEIAELAQRAVIKLFFAGWVKEWIDAGGGHFDLAQLDALQGPSIAEELVKERVLEDAFRANLRGDAGFESAEVVLLAGHDDDVFGGEAVFQGIHGRDGLAFRSARSGGRGSFCKIGQQRHCEIPFVAIDGGNSARRRDPSLNK
ncbi:MAG: hypothetical protein JJE04_25705 [Acidobacteriia bacterium]|nr:hypothetical protein [Terriglobia bacterium]